MYTVKQLSDLAGVSVRTLHYYDEIGLLSPSKVGSNGYRYYDEQALLRLQQVLFYREIGFELTQIKDVLDSPGFDLVSALRGHRAVLEQQIKRLGHLIDTVDTTIRHLQGEIDMPKKKLFQAFSEEQQKDYEREARLQYGPDNVNESVRRWNSYSKEKRQQVMDEGNVIYSDIVAAIEAERDPSSPEVQALFERWHQHIRYFYEPSLEVLRGLGVLYTTHPQFIANMQAIHPNLPDYMLQGIDIYVDELETQAIRRLLAEDDEQQGKR